MPVEVEPVGVLIVRVWIEGGTAVGLRARITELTELRNGEPVTQAAATIDDICAVVRAWLDAFVNRPGPQ